MSCRRYLVVCSLALRERGGDPKMSDVDQSATWDVSCPNCDALHALRLEDLGARLECAGCGKPFSYDEPLREARRMEARSRAESAEFGRKLEDERIAKEREDRARRRAEEAERREAQPNSRRTAPIRMTPERQQRIRDARRSDEATARGLGMVFFALAAGLYFLLSFSFLMDQRHVEAAIVHATGWIVVGVGKICVGTLRVRIREPKEIPPVSPPQAPTQSHRPRC